MGGVGRQACAKVTRSLPPSQLLNKSSHGMTHTHTYIHLCTLATRREFTLICSGGFYYSASSLTECPRVERVRVTFTAKMPYAVAEDSSHTAFLTVNLTLTRTSAAALIECRRVERGGKYRKSEIGITRCGLRAPLISRAQSGIVA